MSDSQKSRVRRFKFLPCGCLTWWCSRFQPDWHGSMPDSSQSSSHTKPLIPSLPPLHANRREMLRSWQTQLEQHVNTFLGVCDSWLKNSEKWSRICIELPLCQNVFSTACEGEMRNFLLALLRIKREKNGNDKMQTLCWTF